ncbi:hypothetical protein [Nocardioides sp. WS12]|uniref:hypothetical protein n=1 Tax=Nocardioides sp. WS12 TaxID=2486272 RepID=UPI0015FBA74C|nr:hypothetical protein [Nocardioides sp. WS12]
MTRKRVLGSALLLTGLGMSGCAGEDPVKIDELDPALNGLAVVDHELDCYKHEFSKRCNVDVEIEGDATSEEIAAVVGELENFAGESKVTIQVVLADTGIGGRIGSGTHAVSAGASMALARELEVERFDGQFGREPRFSVTPGEPGRPETTAVQLADVGNASVVVLTAGWRYEAEPGDDLTDEDALLSALGSYEVDGATVSDGKVSIRLDDDADLAAAEKDLRADPAYAKVASVEVGYDVKAGPPRDHRFDDLEVIEEALADDPGLIDVTNDGRLEFVAANPTDGQRLDRLLRERAADVYREVGSAWTLGDVDGRHISVIQPQDGGKDWALAIALWADPQWAGANVVVSGDEFAHVNLYPVDGATPYDLGLAMAEMQVDQVGAPVTLRLSITTGRTDYDVNFTGSSLALSGDVPVPDATLQDLKAGWSKGVETR